MIGKKKLLRNFFGFCNHIARKAKQRGLTSEKLRNLLTY